MRRPGADGQRPHRNPPSAQLLHDRDIIADALFEHQPAEEQRDQLLVPEALLPAPRWISTRGAEQTAVHATAPQTDAVVAAQAFHLLDNPGCRCEHMMAPAVKAPQMRFRQRPRPAEPIMFEIGLEA